MHLRCIVKVCSRFDVLFFLFDLVVFSIAFNFRSVFFSLHSATTHHRTMNCGSDAAVVSSTISNNHSNSNNNANTSSPSSRRENMSAASKAAMWPTGFSRVLAACSCTIGLFNISRFSIFSILFGGLFLTEILLFPFILIKSPHSFVSQPIS